MICGGFGDRIAASCGLGRCLALNGPWTNREEQNNHYQQYSYSSENVFFHNELKQASEIIVKEYDRWIQNDGKTGSGKIEFTSDEIKMCKDMIFLFAMVLN